MVHGEVERLVYALEGVRSEHGDLVDHDDVGTCEPREVRRGLLPLERRTLEETIAAELEGLMHSPAIDEPRRLATGGGDYDTKALRAPLLHEQVDERGLSDAALE